MSYYKHCTHDEQPLEAEADLCNVCLPWLGIVKVDEPLLTASEWLNTIDLIQTDRWCLDCDEFETVYPDPDPCDTLHHEAFDVLLIRTPGWLDAAVKGSDDE